jgi:hypothetical protein
MVKNIFILVSILVLTSSFQKKKKKNSVSIPVCVQQLISRFRKEEKQNPPRSIYRYSYKGRTVYYVTAPCCDFYSDLYNSACTIIAHPDGGFTGRGDGRAPDFLKERKNEKLLWKDNR